MNLAVPVGSGCFSADSNNSNSMKTWPADKLLAPVFPENRVSSARVLLFALCHLWRFLRSIGRSPWTVSSARPVATALFDCSLPMQGLWWLGKRSVMPLPPTLLNWFHEVRVRLEEAGQAIVPVEGKPTYQVLADVLKRAFKQLDCTFLDDL